MTVTARLEAGLGAVGVKADAQAIERLEGWLALHGRWSKRINLTGPVDVDELIDRHVLDCAAVIPLLPAGPLLDVGSGAGLPGLVIAILEPWRRVYLLEILERRCAFLEHVVLTLGLTNVSVERARCEDWQPPVPLAGVLARAVAPLPRLLQMTAPLLAEGAPLLAMKGPGWRDEMEGQTVDAVLAAETGYRLPGRERDYVLLRFEKQAGDGPLMDEEGR